jgi:hypothetical protein
MVPHRLAIGLAAAAFLAILAYAAADFQAAEPAQTASGPEVTGPFDYANLAVYLVHGRDRLPGNVDITVLESALEADQLVVHETKKVNRLAVENRSGDYVFLQAGDIVGGGWQDRVIAYDLVVPPRSGKVQLGAFCVESGRWSGRGRESEAVFNSASYAASGKELKQAYREAKSQSEVWEKVQEAQLVLGRALSADVRVDESASSMALSLGHPEVEDARTRYTRTLADAADGTTDVVGFAYAVNGELSGANVYGSKELFMQVWPKMLAAAAVEAISRRDSRREFDWPTAAQVSTLLASFGGEGVRTRVHRRVEEIRFDGPHGLRFESHDATLGLLRTEILTGNEE